MRTVRLLLRSIADPSVVETLSVMENISMVQTTLSGGE
jgi:hypothetical protein